MARLTLNIKRTVLAHARRYAASRGTSVAALAERFLTLVSSLHGGRDGPLPPILASLRRELRGTTVERASYWKYLDRKYR